MNVSEISTPKKRRSTHEARLAAGIDLKDLYSFSPREARLISGIGLKNLYQAMNSGQLPSRKYGKRRIILARDLASFLEGLPAPVPRAA